MVQGSTNVKLHGGAPSRDGRGGAGGRPLGPLREPSCDPLPREKPALPSLGAWLLLRKTLRAEPRGQSPSEHSARATPLAARGRLSPAQPPQGSLGPRSGLEGSPLPLSPGLPYSEAPWSVLSSRPVTRQRGPTFYSKLVSTDSLQCTHVANKMHTTLGLTLETQMRQLRIQSLK